MMTQDAQRDLVFIASYPKSGNTWLRFMLCNLLYGRQTSAFTVAGLAPDIHEIGAEQASRHHGLLKTHFPLSPSMPLVARGALAVYVVRRPDDVLISNFYYAQRRSGAADDSKAALDRYFEAFLAHRGDPQWAQAGMGCWDDHVRGWLEGQRPIPVVGIRYEDLKRNPVNVCHALARILRPATTAAEVREAVENSTFEQMRAIEQDDIRAGRIGIFYKPYLEDAIRTGARFMRRGAVGDGRVILTAGQQARLAELFAPMLRKLRYDQ